MPLPPSGTTQPAGPYEWPNPQPITWSASWTGWLQQSTLAPDVSNLPLSFDWGVIDYISWYRSWTQNLLQTTLSSDTTHRPLSFDWGIADEITWRWYQSWTLNLLQSTLKPGPRPFAQLAWPNPPPVSWYQNWTPWGGQLLLKGKDRIYGGPGKVPVYAWPNPTPVSWYQNWTPWGGQLLFKGKDRIYGGPGKVPAYDWPNPQAVIWYQNWTENSILPTPTITAVPFRQQDWPVPQRITWLPFLLQGPLSVTPQPFGQSSWPNPQRVNWYQDWSVNLQLSTLSRPVAAQKDWPNPSRVGWYQDWSQSLALGLTPPVRPFAQLDWPLARAQESSIDLRTFVNQGGQRYLTGQDQLPNRQQDWPLPSPVSWYRDWLTNLVVNVPLGPKPFAQLYWPNPQPITWYRDWSGNLVLTFPSGKPFNQQDWPNPQPAVWYRDWSQALATLFGVSPQPFRQADWAVPPTAFQPDRGWVAPESLPLRTFVPAPMPFNVYTWPLQVPVTWSQDWSRNLMETTLAPPPPPPSTEIHDSPFVFGQVGRMMGH